MASLAAARHGVFSDAEAVGLGATNRMIYRRTSTKRWERVHPLVYRVAGTPASWRQSLLAACLAAGDRAVASHCAACALWQLSGVQPGAIEISAPLGRRVRIGGVTVHHVSDLGGVDVAYRDAIPVTTPTRTLIDLAGLVSPAVVEEALDDALRRGLTTMPRLRWRLSELRRQGRPGIRAMHRLLEERTPGGIPQSVLETRLLRLLRGARLPTPVCQHKVQERGRLIAIVDFAYPDVRLAVEVDGFRWHSGRARWEHDLARRNELTNLGWRVVHVTARDIELRPGETVRQIAHAMNHETPRPR